MQRQEALRKEAVQEDEVVNVVDGDTVKLKQAGRCRLIGVNTPETVAPRQKEGAPPDCYGPEATTGQQGADRVRRGAHGQVWPTTRICLQGDRRPLHQRRVGKEGSRKAPAGSSERAVRRLLHKAGD
ncbi:nucI [Symbiodinium sp. KB8]|nr:nucI [Symbiodinium sp. KB8]